MPLQLHWPQIALRLSLAAVASFLIGLNRDEHGHPAGIRTTMLVCLAATLAMVQMNLLLPVLGKSPGSFSVMDVMRLPLGILDGIGFIGAGVIMKRESGVTGVTTAATMWFVTVLGLLFGGGQLWLGVTGSAAGLFILSALKLMERRLPTSRSARLHLRLSPEAPSEAALRDLIHKAGCSIADWRVSYEPANALSTLDCELRWRGRVSRSPHTPDAMEQLRSLPGILSIAWHE